jgi:3-hydroxyacyl-CoA dehydrogenase
MLSIQTVAVLGTGRDAVRFALACSLAGLEVRVHGGTAEDLDAAFHALRRDVEQALAAGVIGRDERQRILDGILFTPELDEALVGADLVHAAGVTDPAAAGALLPQLAAACRATTLLATPLDPAATAAGVPQPGRVVGLVLEGAEALPSVALRSGPATTPHARERGEQLAARLRRVLGERA